MASRHATHPSGYGGKNSADHEREHRQQPGGEPVWARPRRAAILPAARSSPGNG